MFEYACVLAMMFVFGAAGAKALGLKVTGGGANAGTAIEAAAAATTGDRVGAAPSTTDRARVAPSTKPRSARLVARGR